MAVTGQQQPATVEVYVSKLSVAHPPQLPASLEDLDIYLHKLGRIVLCDRDTSQLNHR